jgi:nickel-dependent lactate racemase
MRYEVKYGNRSLALDVDDSHVAGVLKPRAVKSIQNVERAVQNAIRRPVGAPPLETLLEGKRTALLVTVDHTRPSPRDMLLPVLRLCERAGVHAAIMIATGRHRQMTHAELVKHLGRDLVKQHTILQHAPFDDSVMVKRGKTARKTPVWVNKAIEQHDLVVGVGIIEPSYLCGWSGGRKLLMPGLAHHTAIDNNHYFLTQPGAKIGRLHGNPVSDDAAEFASGLPLHFIVYTIAGPNDECVKIVAGDPVKAHETACGLSRTIYKVPRREAEIVISSVGGRPYDCDLVQGKKAVIPAIETVKRNGVIILCAECADGLGAEKTFLEWLTQKTPLDVTRDVLDRKLFNLGAHGANILAKPIVEKNARVILVTRKAIAEQVKGSYVTCTTSLQAAYRTARFLTGSDAKVLFIESARRLIVE